VNNFYEKTLSKAENIYGIWRTPRLTMNVSEERERK
jgi:hypothetical protein